MNCEEARKLLSDRLDRPLTTEQAAQLREHLITCAACREFNRALNDSVAGLGLLSRSLPSDRVRDGVNSYVAFHPEYGEGQHRGWMRQAAGLSAAAIVLVAVSALLIVMLRGQTGGPSSGSQLASQPTKQNQVMSAPATKSKATPRTYTVAPSPMTPSASATQQTPAPAVAQSTAAPNGSTQSSASATSPAAEPSPSTTPTPAPPAFTAAQAKQTVEDYFNAINQKDYAGAWSLFSDQMRASQGAPSLTAFADGYNGTDHDVVHVIANTPDAATGNYNVMVQVAAYQTDGTIKWFSGTYTVGQVGDQPMLVAANVRAYPGSDSSASVDNSLPACTSDQLSPQVLTGPGQTNDRSYNLDVANSGATCRLSTTLTVTITDANNDILWVFGNDQPQSLVITVPSGGVRQYVDWKNWCAAPADATVAVKLGGQNLASFDKQATPKCTDVQSPTTIGMGETTPNSGSITWTGTVVSVDADNGIIKLRMPDQQIRTVNVVDPMATINDPQNPGASVSAIQAGETLKVRGQMSANGNTLVADELDIGATPSTSTALPTPTTP